MHWLTIKITSPPSTTSYDNPTYAKTYVHRVGRIARAGARGTAILITVEEEEEGMPGPSVC